MNTKKFPAFWCVAAAAFPKWGRGFVVSAFLGLGIHAVTVPLPAQAADPARAEPFTLQLHWIPDSHQLGFWTALDKGFYRDNGLDITVRPGGLDANPIKDVLSGSADVGQVGGIEQVCAAVSEGLPVKALASIHRETPHALISLSTKPIRGPEDFAGKTLAVAFGDTAEVLLQAYMVQAGVNPSKVKLVPYRFDLTPLLSGQVDAITGFATGQPATIEKMGRTPVVLSYASAGVSSYGYTLLSSERTIAQKPAALGKFMKATRAGWEYAFAHPDDAIALFKKRFGDSVDEALSHRELALIKPLMAEADGKLSPWKLDENKVQNILKFLAERGQLKGKVAAASVFNNSYTE